MARYLYLLMETLIQIQEDLLFIENLNNEDDNDKRTYILTAIKRILEFTHEHIESAPFNTGINSGFSQSCTEDNEINEHQDSNQKP